MAHPRKSPVRDRLWKSIRILREFDTVLLALAASAGLRTTQSYCKWLELGKFITIIARAEGRIGKPASYRLARDVGPRGPHNHAVKPVRKSKQRAVASARLRCDAGTYSEIMVLRHLKKAGEASSDELAKICGLLATSQAVVLKSLVESGAIITVGPDRFALPKGDA